MNLGHKIAIKLTMQEKFTIEEIKNYIKSQDSIGDVMYNLKAENIIAANTNNFKTWFTDKFNELADEFSNAETIDAVDITEVNNDITIHFSVDHDDNGIRKHSIQIIQDSMDVRMRLDDIYDGSDLPGELHRAIAEEFHMPYDAE